MGSRLAKPTAPHENGTAAPFEPVRIRGLLGRAWGLYRGSWTRIALPALALSLPLFLIPVIAYVSWGRGSSPGALWAGVFFARGSLFQLVGSLLVTAGAVVMTDRLRGRDTRISQAAARLQPQRSAVMIAALYSVMLALAGNLLRVFALVVPVLLLGPPILAQVVALENKAAAAAVPRARTLLKGHLLRVLGSLFPLVLGVRVLELGLYFAVFATLDGAGVNQFAALALIEGALRGVVSGLVILPFAAALSLASYLDLRARAERFDLETLAAEAL
jgi:hypothetical protein